jgi:hypothetical protein
MRDKLWRSRAPAGAATLKKTTMNKHRILRAELALRTFLIMMVALFAIDASAQIGHLYGLSGSATLKKGTGRPVAAKVGDAFETGTTVATGGDGRVALKFADGQVVVLGPGSTLNAQQYRFDAQDVRGSGLAIALEGTGTMRFMGGVIASRNHQAVRISAGESTVSVVRAGGVDFTITVRDPGQEVGVAAVTTGEICVRTPYGPICSIDPGQAAWWGPGRPLAPPVPLAAAPAAIQAELAALLAIPTPGLESLIAALPPTAAGPEPAAPANPWVVPFAPITSLTTPGGRGCVGSPC